MGALVTCADRRGEQTAIKDQGPRPTCVPFAVTAGHEWLCEDSPNLSEEFALWAAKARDGISGEATTMEAALTGIVSAGQARETDWPYGTPPYPSAPPASVHNDSVRRRLHSWNVLGDSMDELRATILLGEQAVCLRLAFVPRAWTYAASGWVDADGSDPHVGYHAVLAVGVSAGVDMRPWAVIVKNSWGMEWGDRGFGYVSANYLSLYPWRAYGMTAT